MSFLTRDQIGDAFDVTDEQTIRFGTLDVRFSRRDGEWHVAHSYNHEEDEGEGEAPPGTPKTARWVARDGAAQATLLAMMPDRPVVVRPEFPVNLPGGLSMTLFVGIPLWLVIETDHTRIIDLPSVRLSNTWFGTPVEGSLCYAMRTRALRHPDALAQRLHRAICTVEIHNSAPAPLAFSRLCIPCEHLSLFKGGERLWTNAMRMHHRGEDEWSRIVYAEKPPAEAGPAEALTPPRVPQPRGLLMRHFSRS